MTNLLETPVFTGVGLMKAQANMLAEIESMSAAWMARRQEALHDLRHLADALAESTEPGDVLRAQQDYLTAAMTRLTRDVAGLQKAAVGFMGAGVFSPPTEK